MRLAGSVGIAMALAGIVSATPRQYDEATDSYTTSSSISGRSKDGNLSTTQSRLITQWDKIKKADDVANAFNLNLTYRFSIFASTDKDTDKTFSIQDLGPNSKTELINLLIAMVGNLPPDAVNAIYTTLPQAYQQAYNKKNSGTKTTVITTTSSSLKNGLKGSESESMDDSDK